MWFPWKGQTETQSAPSILNTKLYLDALFQEKFLIVSLKKLLLSNMFSFTWQVVCKKLEIWDIFMVLKAASNLLWNFISIYSWLDVRHRNFTTRPHLISVQYQWTTFCCSYTLFSHISCRRSIYPLQTFNS